MTNNLTKSKVAIFGATGHIGKNLTLYFSQEKKYELFLFSRDVNRLHKIIDKICPGNSFSMNNYDNFGKFTYDIIINCVGISNPREIEKNSSSIIKITEHFDNKIIDYLETHQSTLYINMSSGVVYGHDFAIPADESIYSKLTINNPSSGYFYSIAKINSEAKHRAFQNLNIIDLRLFNFFSRFIDLSTNFFISDVVSSIKNKVTLSTSPEDIKRDFVHPEDLYSLIQKCIMKGSLNDSFDVYSKSPISKFQLLDNLSVKYNLKYVVKENVSLAAPTGNKENYYSSSRKAATIGYFPRYSSLETIMSEIGFILNAHKD